MELEEKNAWQKFKNFIVECKRVLIVTKKPTSFEFKTIMKVTGIGIIIIGLIGFIFEVVKLLVTGQF